MEENMGRKVFIKTVRGKTPEKRYRIIDVVEATGYTYGTVSGFIKSKLNTKVREGMTLDEIVLFIESDHKETIDRRSIPDPKEVQEILDRLSKEKGYNAQEKEEITFVFEGVKK